tara:strand:+ start:12 stop:464 length:453 start_codon:yes stop_codon:yes gene_type:complete
MNKVYLSVSILAIILFVTGADNTMALCIEKEKANLRKGPSTKQKKIWQVFQYMPFKLLSTKGNWKKVEDLDGDSYWVHKRLTTQKYKCAVIKKNKTNLRKGPGTEHPKVKWAPVDKYFSMKVLEVKNNWVHIEDAAGDRAWVYHPLVWVQ